MSPRPRRCGPHRAMSTDTGANSVNSMSRSRRPDSDPEQCGAAGSSAGAPQTRTDSMETGEASRGRQLVAMCSGQVAAGCAFSSTASKSHPQMAAGRYRHGGLPGVAKKKPAAPSASGVSW